MASRSIDAIVLTRAHETHCGFLPRLVELGFEGPVYAGAKPQARLAAANSSKAATALAAYISDGPPPM